LLLVGHFYKLNGFINLKYASFKSILTFLSEYFLFFGDFFVLFLVPCTTFIKLTHKVGYVSFSMSCHLI